MGNVPHSEVSYLTQIATPRWLRNLSFRRVNMKGNIRRYQYKVDAMIKMLKDRLYKTDLVSMQGIELLADMINDERTAYMNDKIDSEQ